MEPIDLAHLRRHRVPAQGTTSDEGKSTSPRKKVPTCPQSDQRRLWLDLEAVKSTLAAKLTTSKTPFFAESLERCHTYQTIAVCSGCRKVQRYWNRCEKWYCPCCAGRLSRERRKSIEWWVERIKQPKHVILTVRNSQAITPQYVQWFKDCWAKLRRSKLACAWKGGFYSIECTNEARGWHLHLHALVDCRFIPVEDLSRRWAKIVGQDFAIVRVKDCRAADYLHEVCKYVCDPQAMVTWHPDQISAFLTAMEGQRTFGCFGTLYKARAEHTKFLDEVREHKFECDCGCTEFTFYTEQEWEWAQTTTGPPPGRPQPPPQPDPQIALLPA